jgi:putative SOS response-associated peptidase YedK
MCGRTALTAKPEDLEAAFGLVEVLDFAPRYNLAPSQPTAVVRVPGKLEWLQWGLVPSWADDRKIAHKLALARSETAFATPAFRDAIRKRRCLVIVTSFFEWQRAGRTGAVPFLFERSDRKPFALAGVWDRWIAKDGEVVESCAILTQKAAWPIDTVHDRMPVLMDREAGARWIDAATEEGEARALLAPRLPELRVVSVGLQVNDPRNDSPACHVPALPAQAALFPA